jgi:hypothetical protein
MQTSYIYIEYGICILFRQHYLFNLFGIISFAKTESDIEHLYAEVRLFITILLRSSVVLLTSCILAAVITTDDSDIPS